MNNRKIRWSKVYESSEEELVELLRSRNVKARRITAAESITELEQVSGYDFTIWCAEGSLVLRQKGSMTSLQPGDAISVNRNDHYDLLAGMTGYVCYITG